MDNSINEETPSMSLEEKSQNRASKRYSFSFYGFRKSSTAGESLKRSISISSPTLLDDQQRQELPQQLTNSIYNNQGFNERKRGSYALCQSLEMSLAQSSSTVILRNNQTLIVPSIVVKCCDYILSHEYLEGLFRVNGSIKKIKILEKLINERLLDRKDFEFDEFVSSQQDIEEINSYDVSMILKRYLNNLEDFLVDHDNYFKLARNHESLNTEPNSPEPTQSLSSPSPSHDSMMTSAPNSQFSLQSSTASPTTSTENDKQLNIVKQANLENVLKIDAKDLSLKIATPKLHLLLYILQFLHKMTISQEIISNTKMTSLNLSKIFQPSLFEFKVEKQSSTENLLDFYKINELILWRWIDNFEFLNDCLVEQMTIERKTDTLNSSVAATPIATPVSIPNSTPTSSSPISLQPAQQHVLIANPKTRISSRDSVASAEEKKQRRRTIFGYRSISTPNPLNSSELSNTTTTSTTRVASGSAEPRRFSSLKRLPTAIFGSSYSLKTKLTTPLPLPLPPPTLIEQSPRDTTLPNSNLEPSVKKISKQVRQRRRLTLHGFENQKPKLEEREDTTSIVINDELQFGLQRKPLYAHDIKFNQSPASTPALEQSAAF